MARGIGAYRDRDEAGEVLARQLVRFRWRAPIVLAIPNGGVPVGLRIHERLGGDFGLLVVRKLHIPWNREAGFGAVAPDGTVAFNEPLRAALGLSERDEAAVIDEEKAEIARRVSAYGAGYLPSVEGRTAILVDDGLASGYSMLVAANFVRKRNPAELVVAVPTGSAEAVARVRTAVDRLVCPDTRGGPVFAVADAYREWRDLSDEEVASLVRAGGGRIR
ncbi:MAG: phosphoribosyltransferase family protein [Candidatus Thermoplasmatota archaeon]|mgnify:CR=1 FL=1